MGHPPAGIGHVLSDHGMFHLHGRSDPFVEMPLDGAALEAHCDAAGGWVVVMGREQVADCTVELHLSEVEPPDHAADGHVVDATLDVADPELVLEGLLEDVPSHAFAPLPAAGLWTLRIEWLGVEDTGGDEYPLEHFAVTAFPARPGSDVGVVVRSWADDWRPGPPMSTGPDGGRVLRGKLAWDTRLDPAWTHLAFVQGEGGATWQFWRDPDGVFWVFTYNQDPAVAPPADPLLYELTDPVAEMRRAAASTDPHGSPLGAEPRRVLAELADRLERGQG